MKILINIAHTAVMLPVLVFAAAICFGVAILDPAEWQRFLQSWRNG